MEIQFEATRGASRRDRHPTAARSGAGSGNLCRVDDVAGCIACDLSSGRVDLPGGLIHETTYWRVEHCVGPLGVGTLIVKPSRHVVHVADLTADEADELGAVLRRASSVVTRLTPSRQVYVCLWSHGPAHVHFVVQPVSDELMDRLGAHGPALQLAMFESEPSPDPAAVADFADAARAAFEHA
jgi:diadenosine tetraphosphate (Ap4A) HIT family hydrolase